MLLQVIQQPGIDLLAYERVIEQGCANTDGGGTRDHEFNGVARGCDPALSDDGHVMFLRDLVDLVHLEQRDRPARFR